MPINFERTYSQKVLLNSFKFWLSDLIFEISFKLLISCNIHSLNWIKREIKNYIQFVKEDGFGAKSFVKTLSLTFLNYECLYKI